MHEHDRARRDRSEHDVGGHEHLSHVPESASPAVYAARADVTFDPPADTDRVSEIAGRSLEALSGALAAAGCTLVGHIKGTVAAAGHDGLAFHATALEGPPSLTGEYDAESAQATLTINVIVFGVDERTLPAMVRDAWSRVPGAEVTWRP